MEYTKRIRIIFILFVIIAVHACKKGQNCLTNTGTVITVNRIVEDFDSIYLNDNVTLILKQEAANSVTVEAGENIISGITTVVNGGRLIIHNENSCNWLRDYTDPVNVYVSFSSSKPCLDIYYNSSGNVKSTNLIVNDTIQIDTWGGCGTIDLLLNCRKGTFVQHMGTVDFKLQGICDESNIYAGDYGLFDCRDLKTGYTYIKNYGTNDSYVRAIHQLHATIGSIGNIYYMTNPAPLVILKTPSGTDQVIPMPGK